eukprot:3602046-Amphidinium_carterae.1
MGVGGINEFINDQLSDEVIYEDVDKLMEVAFWPSMCKTPAPDVISVVDTQSSDTSRMQHEELIGRSEKPSVTRSWTHHSSQSSRRLELKKQWERVSGGSETFTFAVRSSATAEEAEARPIRVKRAHQNGTRLGTCSLREVACLEDLPDASFAGQQETYLNVMGYADLKEKVAALLY